MIAFLETLKGWHWWAAAAALAAIETFFPGAVAIWFAAAAFVVGCLVVFLPIPWGLQLILFGVLGIIAVVVYRRYARAQPKLSELPMLNQRGAQYIGQQLTLMEPIVNGAGKARVGDSVWTVHGPDLPLGARVRVTGIDGTALVVDAST